MTTLARVLAVASVVSILWPVAPQPGPIERRLYVSTATGISVYDVDPIQDIGPHNTWINPAAPASTWQC